MNHPHIQMLADLQAAITDPESKLTMKDVAERVTLVADTITRETLAKARELPVEAFDPWPVGTPLEVLIKVADRLTAYEEDAA